MKDLFTTVVDVAGGREGRAVAQDGKLDVTLAFPQEIGGSGAGTNPEQRSPQASGPASIPRCGLRPRGWGWTRATCG